MLRYERECPGELLHIDTKRLGRFHQVGKAILRDGIQRSPRAGWHYLHVAVDDHTRIAYCEVLAGQGAEHSCAFLSRAVAWFASEHGTTIERVLTTGSLMRLYVSEWGERVRMRGAGGRRSSTPVHCASCAAGSSPLGWGAGETLVLGVQMGRRMRPDRP